MLKKVGFALGALVWFGVVFVAVLYVTFPSDAASERARYEVQTQSQGDYELELSGIRPAFVGLTAQEPTLLSVPRSGQARAMMSLDGLTLRAGLFDAIRLGLGGEGAVHAVLSRGGGDIDASVEVSRDGNEVAVRGVEIAGAVPLSALPPMGGISLLGEGELDLESELSWAGGLGKADGFLKIEGRDLTLVGLASEDGSAEQLLEGFEGLPAAVSRLVIDMDVVSGKATVRKGRIDSDLVNVEIGGDVTLSDDIGRSRVRLSLVVELGPSLDGWIGADLVKQTQKAALWKDGKYHYTLSGVLSRLGAPRAERERTASRARTPTASPAATPSKPVARSTPVTSSARDRDANPPAADQARGRLAAAREKAARAMEEEDDEEMDLEDELDELIPEDEELFDEEEELLDDEELLDEEYLDEEE